MAQPYIDSFWCTKKRQIPFKLDDTVIVWETSYGMTVKNPSMLPSEDLRQMIDDAIERAFENDLKCFTNVEFLEHVLSISRKFSGDDNIVHITSEQIINDNTIKQLDENQLEHFQDHQEKQEQETTSEIKDVEPKPLNELSLSELIERNLISVGMPVKKQRLKEKNKNE